MNSAIKERLSQYGIFISLFVFVIFNMIFTHNFASTSTLWNLIIYSTNVLLIAMGMNLVIATGGIDISVGATMAFAATLMAILIPVMGIIPAIIISLIGAAIVGVLIGFIVERFNVVPIIATLSASIALRGLAQILTAGQNITLRQDPIFDITYMRIGGIPIQLGLFIIVALIFYILVEKTVWGRYISAVGDNEKAANIMGVSVSKIKILVFSISALMAGMAGILEASRLLSVNPNSMGNLIELDAIAAVAIGGTYMSGGRPKIIHTVAGLLIMQLITMMVNMNDIPFAYSLVLKTVVIILAVYIQKRKV